MDLQLGLALPTHAPVFDPNKTGSDQAKENIALADSDGCDSPLAAGKMTDEPSRTIMGTVFVWSGQPNEEDDRCPRKVITNKIGEEKDQVIVGWPPMKRWRKDVRLSQQQQVERMVMMNNGRSMFVKVKMQGVAIARKIDVTLYHSYHPLLNSLIHMFSINQNCREDVGCYMLTYQDMEGDWMLVRDVPWQTFISTVQRLVIRRSS